MALKNLLKRDSFLSYDLKTGGKIIGYIHIVFLILNILRLFYVLYEWGLSIWLEVTVSVFLVIVNAVWLYGIEKENLSYMLPDLIISVICVCVLIIYFVWLPIGEYYHVQSAFPKKPETSEELYAEQDEVRNFFFIWWIVGALFVFEWYFTTVKICLYQLMKVNKANTNNGSAPTNGV